MSVTKEELNKIAIEYHNKDSLEDKFIEDLCQFHTYDWVFSELAGCQSVLELGFGEGNFTAELVSRKFNPTIVEGSSILTSKAKELYGDKISITHSLFEEYQPTSKFDAILATHVLEHLDQPQTLLIKMREWLNPNGKLIVIVPNNESIHRQLAVIMGLQEKLDSLGSRDLLVGHQRVYSIATLTQELLASGYTVESTEGFFLKPLPNSMMTGFSKELIVALNKISTIMPKNLLANIGMVAKKI